jgi:ATP-dependent Lhr-like helicase
MVPAPATPEKEWTPVHEAILRQLREGGASFFGELVRAASVHPRDTLDALWDLVWAGLVTNDAFGALRALAWPKRETTSRHPPRSGGLVPPEAAGRWSLVSDGGAVASTPTARAHALANQLLDRYGVVTREGVSAEGIAGGFSAVYPVLKAMEEAGKVRRGYFVEGLGAAQFALPGAVERLRAEREAPDEPVVHLVAALDPANPYGASVPWPQREGEERRVLARAAGARVVLVDGEPVLYLERGGRGLVTLPAFERPALAELSVAAILPRAADGRPIVIERIDGEQAGVSRHAAMFLESGFVHAYRGLSYRQPTPRRTVIAGG